MKILGFCGSLRKGSYNRMLLNAATRLAPDGVEFEIYDGLRELPHFDQDFEKNQPEVVRDLKARVKAADGLLFVTPEYNHSIPGPLKNAIDWLSRPSGDNSLASKSVAVFGCGGSTFGAVRMQIAFREILFSLSVDILPRLEVIVFRAQERFDSSGNLTDEVTIGVVKEALELLKDRIETAKEIRELRAARV
ncbi:MAG TPA: NAD(P)H-dependent oxidoreductase [Candidatus Acidoferrales bacterium]|nr:NAD(P)H-dependent oxidoreductase [Candidatus Acidoferrales bacterium]